MDTTKLIELLNGDLELEYRSIVQYVQHIATAKGAEFQSTIEELRAHLGQELDHATALAEQIDFLGGVPSVTVPSVPEAADTRAALTLDLELERGQLERYRERVGQTEQMGLGDVTEAIRPLLQQTQDHVRDLQGALGL
ncbi:MAG: ferritin-like domain-containing protein [Acidimicrobiia bacterium]|nr:ferritin-like domain-containing protein [Acidimicrobiia bacterium]